MAEDRDGPMSTIDAENPRSGWSAECHDCPYRQLEGVDA
ncbi:hypothetical protein PBI_TERROR_50 [Mycobacterium phage Terror]|uniref:Uncharacterized protein n=1 Tax=Mycobacterium phage Taheera TaxID=1897549 RepID=A0A1D8EVV9_9CAUD|nr:hypothetical protein KDW70_gp50 [Mycobacterium phage Taheera]AOT25161.1 hypothetical protein PBI_TAHEERA_50 [Mycobacterium phage Taheera]AOT25219.1 hypothetical protein PBI_TERROR_50 [Mycobacterium phage Terror]